MVGALARGHSYQMRPSFHYECLDLAELARAHKAGASINELCRQQHIPDPKKVRQLLRAAGYHVRGRGEAQTVRWAKQRE